MKHAISSSYPMYDAKTLGRTKGEKYVKKINTFMQMVNDNIDLNYQKMVLNQLKVKQQQSRVVVLKAARVSSNEAASILESEFARIDEYFSYYEEAVNNLSKYEDLDE